MIRIGNWSRPACPTDWARTIKSISSGIINPGPTISRTINVSSFHRWLSRSRLPTLAAAAIVVLTACQPSVDEDKPPARLLEKATWNDLGQWSEQDHRPALQAFLKSCNRFDHLKTDAPLGGHLFAGPVRSWQAICNDAKTIDQQDQGAVRVFFEDRFQPFAVSNNGDPDGLFTGYFEPELHGSLTRSDRYDVPLYRLPDDLIALELSGFSSDLEGRRLTGRIENGRFLPYHSRTEIDAGALENRNLEVLWVDDPIEKFFLQIQGSGRILLDDGRLFRVGYAGQNGHPYRAIGRDLIEQGEVSREDMSLQAIDRWLRDHPERALAMMHNNPSYIFFQLQNEIDPDDGPLGAQSVPLTAGHSLAIDRAHLPLGVPIWLETTKPEADGETPYHRLMVAQDVGGAIKGPVRGDVYWGAGQQALETAGRMKSTGRYFILLPKSVGAVS